MKTTVIKTLLTESKQRLDATVANELKVSRKEAKQLIEEGFCEVSGRVVVKASYEPAIGDTVEIREYEEFFKKKPVESTLVPQIIFEDDSIIVLHKPSGLTVHEGSGTTETTLVDWLRQNGFELATCTGNDREGIVHRLDRETSGLMVVAKNGEAADALKAQFKDKSAGRYYVAIIEPPLKEDVTVDAKIARNPKNRIKMSVQKDGRESKSAFKKVALSDNQKFELIAAKLFSGRTHQIRAHLAHLGRNIIGDDLYGFKSQNAKIDVSRVMLHAAVLYFYHPITLLKVSFFAPPPEDFSALFNKLFTKENPGEIFSQSFIASIFSGSN
jgi:23S rRNA pseudouridine1911/1915/1917 synthase